MMLIEEATVPVSALPVSAFKDHLRLGSGFTEDSLQDDVLESFLQAAISAVEARTGKALFRRSFSWTVYGWRDGVAQGLPVAPVSDISEVTLTDTQGAAVTVASSAYQLVQDMHRPCVRGVAGGLPNIPTNGSVTLRFEAGFGATWEEIPADLRQAVLLLAAHYYEFRQETTLSEGCMPFGVTSLLERYRAVRLGLGEDQ
ncbi:phage head-tail connector protein [Shimia sp. R10_1]|uniref:head-tail connector protein n=1 Tax=Shimia sp. R10_1 TaxID=2821095 RepID=UPI001ADD1889|nr:head-tail connector protein [Shimia sp. R10_1]MBO9472019.1 phage head-tail connector protein [Shimia sp. R10_1]